MRVFFSFDRHTIAPNGIEFDLHVIPRAGELLSFYGEVGARIEEWSDDVDDFLVVMYVDHKFNENVHSVFIQCAMSRDAARWGEDILRRKPNQ